VFEPIDLELGSGQARIEQILFGVVICNIGTNDSQLAFDVAALRAQRSYIGPDCAQMFEGNVLKISHYGHIKSVYG
jgi:hypothetical protein